MAKRKHPAAPLSLPPHSVLPLSADLRRLVTRLTKPSLVPLALQWLSPDRVELYAPNLTLDDAGPVDEDREELSLEEVTEVYEDFRRSARIRAKDVAERMLEFEWRDGITLLGVAELEWEYMRSHPTSQKWSSLLLSPVAPAGSAVSGPRFYLPTFLSALLAALHPTQTAHFFTTTHPELPLALIRVSLHEPYTALALPPRRQTFWLAFPQGGEHAFTTLTAGEGLREMVMAGIADGVSRSNSRFEIKAGRFQAKNLEAMCHFRGAEGSSGGLAAGWGIYVEGFESNPLAPPVETTGSEKGVGAREEDADGRKRRKMVEARFGRDEAMEGKAVESVFFELQEKYPDTGPVEGDLDDDEEEDGEGVFRPAVGIRLEGTHVFKGVRQMAAQEKGMFVIEKLPGWAVGDEGVTSGLVREGRVLRKKKGRFYNGA